MVVNPISGTPIIPELRDDLKVKRDQGIEREIRDSIFISENSKQILQNRAYAKETAVKISSKIPDIREEKVSLVRSRLNSDFYQNKEVTENVAENLYNLLVS